MAASAEVMPVMPTTRGQWMRPVELAGMPALYEKARVALRACHDFDELKGVSSKHAAIEVYAKQSKDESLMWYAKRIQLRAFERIGELLLCIDDEAERKALARRHSINLTAANRAYEAAHIPRRARDKLIESSPPPTRTRLADCGRGYMKVPEYQRRSGFRRYADKEEQIKHTPAGRAEELVSYLSAWAHDMDAIAKDGQGGSFAFSLLGRSVPMEGASAARFAVAKILSNLAEFKHALPRGI